MDIIEITNKTRKEYNKMKKQESLKLKWTLLKAKLFKRNISPDDTRTLQAHMDSQGLLRDYYISNTYLQNGASYTCVNTVMEDVENNRFIYRGMLQGADNAVGIIESNVPLAEIVASPDGNIKLQEMLLAENSAKVRNQYYRKIGEKQEPLENHSTFFGKPDFPLGKILKGNKGEFTFSSEISEDIEEMLCQEREEIKREERMRNKESVEIDLGGGMVIAKQNCWLEQESGVQFAGINDSALYYKYMPEGVIQTEDKKYVYIGKVQIGEVKNMEVNPNKPIQFVRPFTYENVVLWTQGKNLIQYFLEEKFNGLNFSLGEIFTNENIKNSTKKGKQVYIGGVTKDSEGECKNIKDIPETVIKTVEEHMIQKENKKDDKIIKFE